MFCCILTRFLVATDKGVYLYLCVVWSLSFLPEAVESGRGHLWMRPWRKPCEDSKLRGASDRPSCPRTLSGTRGASGEGTLTVLKSLEWADSAAAAQLLGCNL